MVFVRLLFLFVLTASLLTGCTQREDWYSASRASAGIAPDALTTREAVLQVYGADTWGWRGWFAIHTWIAVKRKGEEFYTIYDVVGWRGYYGEGVLAIRPDVPDRYWYGAKPELLQDHRGVAAEDLIEAVDTAARAYPWKYQYEAFPGPNSNTFTAWVGRQVPQLELELPWSAFGSGYASRSDQAQ